MNNEAIQLITAIASYLLESMDLVNLNINNAGRILDEVYTAATDALKDLSEIKVDIERSLP